MFRSIEADAATGRISRTVLAGALNGLGNILCHERGDCAAAVASYRRATDLVPGYAYAWHDMLLAQIILAKGGQVDTGGMRHALDRLRDTAPGVPGITPEDIASLSQEVDSFAGQTEKPKFKELWTVGNWKGFVFRDAKGNFERCAAIAHYENNTALSFSYDIDKKLWLRATNEAFKKILQPGQAIAEDLMIDDKEVGKLTGEATRDDQIKLYMGNGADLLRKVKDGSSIQLQGMAVSTDRLSLQDVAKALPKLVECLPQQDKEDEPPKLPDSIVSFAPLSPEINPSYFLKTDKDLLRSIRDNIAVKE